MVAKIADISHLPYWPRLLSREHAAAYVGVSPTTFDTEVRNGVWPQPIRRGGADSKRQRLTWDRLAIDRCIDNGDLPEAPDTYEDDYARREREWKAQIAAEEERKAARRATRRR